MHQIAFYFYFFDIIMSHICTGEILHKKVLCVVFFYFFLSSPFFMTDIFIKLPVEDFEQTHHMWHE